MQKLLKSSKRICHHHTLQSARKHVGIDMIKDRQIDHLQREKQEHRKKTIFSELYDDEENAFPLYLISLVEKK